jgi:hypothetical protein
MKYPLDANRISAALTLIPPISNVFDNGVGKNPFERSICKGEITAICFDDANLALSRCALIVRRIEVHDGHAANLS